MKRMLVIVLVGVFVAGLFGVQQMVLAKERGPKYETRQKGEKEPKDDNGGGKGLRYEIITGTSKPPPPIQMMSLPPQRPLTRTQLLQTLCRDPQARNELVSVIVGCGGDPEAVLENGEPAVGDEEWTYTVTPNEPVVPDILYLRSVNVWMGHFNPEEVITPTSCAQNNQLRVAVDPSAGHERPSFRHLLEFDLIVPAPPQGAGRTCPYLITIGLRRLGGEAGLADLGIGIGMNSDVDYQVLSGERGITCLVGLDPGDHGIRVFSPGERFIGVFDYLTITRL